MLKSHDEKMTIENDEVLWKRGGAPQISITIYNLVGIIRLSLCIKRSVALLTPPLLAGMILCTILHEK